jgi:transcriptional regulator
MVIDRQQIRYITLRKQIGTQTQVADLLAVTARTVQRRERGAMPITREAWLAIEMLSASPLYAAIRHPVNA